MFKKFTLGLAVAALYSTSSFAYDKSYIGQMEEYTAAYEDTFVHLALEHNLGYTELRAANPLVDPWVPGSRTKIIFPKQHILPDTAHQGLVINLPEMRLFYYPKDGSEPYTFPIGVGREGLATPMGSTSIVRKTEGPTWRPTDRMREANPDLPAAVPPGPENPLGTHALYLGWPQYLIHGTNRPFGIGRRISSGCIRMYPKNIKEVFKLVPVGTPVQVVDQPVKLAWVGDRLYLEAHPNLEDSLSMEESGEIQSKAISEADLERIKKYAGEAGEKIRWPAVRTALRERRGYPIEIARRDSSFSQSKNDRTDEILPGDEGIGNIIRASADADVSPVAQEKPAPETPKANVKANTAGKKPVKKIQANVQQTRDAQVTYTWNN